MVKLQRILCPTDFSEFSRKSVLYGCELAAAFKAELFLLNVLQDYDTLPASGETFMPFTDWVTEVRKQAEKHLLELPGPDWESRVKVHRATRIGATVDEISKHAKEHDVDLIVQSTHGRTGLKHFLMGSVAESVVRYAPCPVLTVRHQEHEFIQS